MKTKLKAGANDVRQRLGKNEAEKQKNKHVLKKNCKHLFRSNSPAEKVPSTAKDGAQARARSCWIEKPKPMLKQEADEDAKAKVSEKLKINKKNSTY